MRTIIMVFIILAIVGLIFGWLLDAQAGASAVAEFISQWTQQFSRAGD